MAHRRTTLPFLLVVMAVLLVAGCGEQAAEQSTPTAQAGHIHGLGVNPSDGALFIATHGGLFRSAEGSTEVARVGNSTQDTMGFTIVGPDRFLGSGHPGEFENGPPLLGLIASDDAATSWTPVSLSGQADFHVLRSTAGRVYGVDSSSGRLMSSSDQGATWAELESPAPLLDLAPDPDDADHLLAAGKGGLYDSDDGGEAWRTVGEEIGFLGWPSAKTLFLLDLDGRVLASTDGGSSWKPRGEIGGEPVAFLASSDEQLYAALADGTVVASSNGGRSFSLRASQ